MVFSVKITKESIKKDIMMIIKENPKTFTKNHMSYFKNVIARCEAYHKLPKKFLEKKLDTLPKMTEWYLNIFQTILLTGIYAANLVAIGNSYQNLNLLETVVYYELTPFNKLIFILKMALPLALNSVTLLLAFIKNDAGSPFLSNIIQEKFLIRRNIAEVEIEMLYISKLLESDYKE